MKRLLLVLLLVAGALAPAASAAHSMRPRSSDLDRPSHTRVIAIHYRAHTGRARVAYVLLPAWYGAALHPRLPLVISPHGRGVDGHANLGLWGDLPGIGGFAVVNPDGEGDHLDAYSWGAPGQIEDLAKMPALLVRALPWLRIDPRRVYAVGGSMGGQETLLLLAKHPRLLAGAAAFDPLVDFAHQYRQFPRLPCGATCRRQLGAPLGSVLQRLAREEVGGDPRSAPSGYTVRSPLAYAAALARACVPLQLWWSKRDRIVVDPRSQAARLLATVRRLNPVAPVVGIEGTWMHSAEMRASTRLPFALAGFGLLPSTFGGRWALEGTWLTPSPPRPCSRAA